MESKLKHLCPIAILILVQELGQKKTLDLENQGDIAFLYEWSDDEGDLTAVTAGSVNKVGRGAD